MAGLEVDDRMTPRELRADVPALGEAARTLISARTGRAEYVVEAASEFLADHEYGSATTDPYSRAFETYETVRERVADFVGAEPDEIALTERRPTGSPGSRVPSTGSPATWSSVRPTWNQPGILPWKRLEREGVEVRVVETEEGRIDREAYAEAVADARLVCFSAITWTHGTRLPVADLVEIADEAGAFTLVDAVQSPGQVAMDVSAGRRRGGGGGGHQWVLGPWGAGFLYVDREAATELAPRAVGYRSVEDPNADEIVFKEGAKRFEVGSTTPAAHVGLIEGARRDRRGRDRDDRRPDRVAHGPAQRRRPRRPSAEPPRVRVRARHDRRRRPRGDGRPARRRGGIVVRSLPHPGGPGVGPRRLHRGRDRPARRAARRRVVSARSDAFLLRVQD